MHPPRDVAMTNPPEFLLPEGALHVWRAGIDLAEEEFAPLARSLSPDELQRAARFRFERDRRRFVAGRGILRSLIAAYLGCRACEIAFVYGARGKPALATAALQFNLAHSDGLAVIGITRSARLGVDVERVRPMPDYLRLADNFFSPRERETIAALPAEDRQRAFFACWTRKEAYVKATGDGLSAPLEQFDVPVVPNSPPRLFHADVPADEMTRWSLWDVPLERGYVGVVAFEEQIDDLRHGVWPGAAADLVRA
jgi:4'-phosphopantetheinyl transferase